MPSPSDVAGTVFSVEHRGTRVYRIWWNHVELPLTWFEARQAETALEALRETQPEVEG